MRLVILAVAVAGSAAAAWASDPALIPLSSTGKMVVYTKDSAPPAPMVDDLPQKDSLTQYGITWTFDKKVPVGQFIGGDYYVVGPVTVTAISPKPLFGEEVKDASGAESNYYKGRVARNGSVLNIPITGWPGFDSRTDGHRYDPNRFAGVPIAMKPGDALISTISVAKLEALERMMGPSDHKNVSAVQAAAVLTCVGKPLPPDAFRPCYGDRSQKIYLARDLKRELLPKLAQPEFQKTGGLLTMPQLADRFVKPWFLLNVFKGDHASYQWGGYGQRSCFYDGEAFLYLCLDKPAQEKEPLLQAMVQFGIECWGVVKSGHPGFPAWGGWNNGYKMPIVLAGVLLGEDAMAAPSKAYPKCSFQEDEQTAYGPCYNGAMVVFCGHSGYDAAKLQSRDKVRGGALWGFYEHLHPSRWVHDQVQSDGYRRCCNSRTWQAQALVMRIMKLEKYWAHDSFFDYVDRWMYQDETPYFEAVSAANVRVGWEPSPEWGKQGQVEDKFAEAMWKAYRTAPGMPPTDGWKTLKKNENGLIMPAVQGPIENPGPPASRPSPAAPTKT
jgi:hypothetical protein